MLSSRYFVYYAALALTVIVIILGAIVDAHFLWPLLVTGPLAALGTWDLVQTRHSVLRNYPILAHMRFLFEGIRPELRQYFFESNLSGTPFSREQRTLVYERAKDQEAKMPFGTELDVYAEDYSWVNHSIAPKPSGEESYRVSVGGPRLPGTRLLEDLEHAAGAWEPPEILGSDDAAILFTSSS